MTERKPTNDKLIIQTNNSYDITYGLKKLQSERCVEWTGSWKQYVRCLRLATCVNAKRTRHVFTVY